MRSATHTILLSAFLGLLAVPSGAAAQSADELAKQTQNPVASLITVPLQGNWDFGLGDREATGTLLNIQPVMPFAVSSRTNAILRVIMPLTSQPGPDSTRVNGLGDIIATAFFSPQNSGRLIWGAGPRVPPAHGDEQLAREREVRHRPVGGRPRAARQLDDRRAVQPHLVGERRDRPRRRQLDLPAAVRQLQPRQRAGGRRSHRGERQLGGGRDVDRTAPLHGQQGRLARQAAGQLRGGSGSYDREPEAGADWRFRLQAAFLFPR